MRMNRRGNYSMMFAVGFPALLGFAAIAIDTARIQQAQQELEQGAQAIAHAALVSIRDGDSKAYAKNKAKRTGKRNFIAGDKVKIRNRHIKFGFWDFDTATWRNSSVGYNAVKVDLAMDDTSDTLMDPLDMMLTPIMGVSYVNLQANQSTIAAFQTRDIMLVVDTTGSFIGEMPLARQAALTLLTEMHDRYIPGDTIGLATFVGDGKVVTSLADSYTQFSSIYGAWDGSSNPAPHAGCTRNSTPGSWDCTGVQWEIDCFWI